jgi:hypothetical protein
MALNRGEVNALGVLGLRRLSFIPQHFTKISIDTDINLKLIEHWIEFNLNGRYSIKNAYGLDSKKNIKQIIEIGFEDPKDLTMLTLGCQFLHRKKEF